MQVEGVAKKIRDARERCGLSLDEVARAAGLVPSMYWDLEAYDDELLSVLSANEARAVCKALKLDLRDVLGLGSVAPNADRSRTIVEARLERNLSQEALGDAIGYYPSVIEGAERNPDGIDDLCLIAIFELEGVLGLPEGTLVASRKGSAMSRARTSNGRAKPPPTPAAMPSLIGVPADHGT